MNRPSLNEIYNRVSCDLNSSTRFSINKILAHAISGTAHMLYGYIEHLAKVSMPDSQDEQMLTKWCSLFNVPRKPAQNSLIRIQIETTEDIHISAGTTWRHDSGAIFVLLNGVDAAQYSEITIECDTDGEVGNIPTTTVKVTATIANLKSQAKVTALLRSGSDIESIESWRARLQERLRRPPQGGCTYDYISWAKAIPGVDRAWVLPRVNGNNGKVLVTYLKKGYPIPTDEECKTVQKKILKLCPATVNLEVIPPQPIELRIRLTCEPQDSITKSDIQKEMEYLLRKKAAPKGFLNESLETETGIIYESDIHQAISAANVKHHLITNITGNIPHENSQIVVFGEVNYEAI